MFITITGELGSGKTTIAKILNQKYGFDFYSTGSIQREIAKEKGISTLELNQLMSNDLNNEYDKMIDNKTIEIGQENAGKDLVFDSRMAWHFVEKSFKVFVTVDSYTAAERVIKADRGATEHYQSVEEAAMSLRKRKRLEDSRFAEIYKVNTTNFGNYDLIIDSTSAKPEELAEFILDKAKTRNAEREIYLSPKRLKPTLTAVNIDADRVKELMNNADDKPVDAVEYDGSYFIVAGHESVCAKMRKGEKLISVKLLSVDDNGMIEAYQRKVSEIVKVSEEVFRDWEAINEIDDHLERKHD